MGADRSNKGRGAKKPAKKAAKKAITRAPKNDSSGVRTAELEARLAELRPQSMPLPQMGGERFVQTSAAFAEIVITYALARNLPTETPEQIQAAARRASLWYYGLEET